MNVERESTRNATGKKMDLIFRDVIQKKDWMMVERMREWDTQSTKFLTEIDLCLFKETTTIMLHRLQDTRNEEMWEKGRFFEIYPGSQGFLTFEVRPTGGMSYVSLFHACPVYDLPATPEEMVPQVQGLAHLLQARQVMLKTIALYQPLLAESLKDDDDDNNIVQDFDWVYGASHTDLDATIDLASSPISQPHSPHLL
ncbi:hypothetical protein BC939DRAFT_530957, partial [Gamsiella multidivaricata]|uniref:uncharacterized protein n=1 Tax=Gamsiella multidivaricata TaxID=101098 RepID=UPI00221ED7D1